MSREPWTSPDVPRWQRVLAWGALSVGGAALWGLLLAEPLVRLWRALVG